MRVQILNHCFRENCNRYARTKVAVIKQNERCHRTSCVSFRYRPTVVPNHRFFSSATITDSSSEIFKNSFTDFQALKSKEVDENPFLSKNADVIERDESSLGLLLENCACHLTSCSNDQLETLLRNVVSVQSKFDKNELLKFTFALDQELNKRAPLWTTKQLLVYFELYSHLPRLKRGDFVYHLAKYRQPKIFRHELNLVVEFVRLMNKRNLWAVYRVPKYDYEIYFSNHLAELSINDLEVFLEFMVKVRLVVNTPNLFQQLCQHILHKLPELSSSGLIYFCQILWLRRSVSFDRDLIDSVVEQLCQYLAKCENLPADVYIEVASLCREESLVDASFHPKFSSKFTRHLGDISFKRIAMGMKYLTHFDEHCKHAAVYDCLINNLRAKSFDEITSCPKDFISIMYYLCRVGIYPADLLDLLFSPKFLAQSYPKGLTQFPLRDNYVLGQELLTIDSGVGIECPHYEGNRLDADVCHNIQRYYCWKLPKLLLEDVSDVNFEEMKRFSRVSTRFLYLTRLALQKVLGGAEFVHTGYLLPHLPRPNLLFALSKEGTSQPLPTSICKMIVDRSALDSDLDWYTFGIYSFGNRASATEEGGARGEEIPKIRQLKKLRFNVLKLAHNEWWDKSDVKIEQYLRNKIFSHIESKVKI